MLFSSSNQYIALALVLLAGWLLGLASSSGGRKWRDRYAAERDASAQARRDAEAARVEHDRRYADQDARYAELQREHDRLSRAAPVTASTVAPARAAAAARPAYPAGERRGWFDFGRA